LSESKRNSLQDPLRHSCLLVLIFFFAVVFLLFQAKHKGQQWNCRNWICKLLLERENDIAFTLS
jgi:hypothetical protein